MDPEIQAKLLVTVGQIHAETKSQTKQLDKLEAKVNSIEHRTRYLEGMAAKATAIAGMVSLAVTSFIQYVTRR